MFFKKKRYFKVPIVIEPDKDRFHAYCPLLKGLHVDGMTEEEAFSNAVDAVFVYLKSLIEHNDPIPDGIESKKREKLPITIPPATQIRQIPVTI